MPWRWYCRWCGHEAWYMEAEARDLSAEMHIRQEHPGPYRIYQASYGSLLHIWPVPEYLGPQ